MLSKKVEFKKAVPVWAEEYKKEMNITVVFRAVVEKAEDLTLRLAGSSAFRIEINGEFLAMGPARAGHGYYRVDEYSLSDNMKDGDNVIDIVVAGYNNNSFYWIDVPPFLCAEIVKGDDVIVCTGVGGENEFTGYRYNERVQKIQRYSFQRNFAEVYDFNNKSDFTKPLKLALADEEEKVFVERGIFYPAYEKELAEAIECRGNTTVSEKEQYFVDRAIHNIGPRLKGFKVDELEICSTWEAEKLDFSADSYEVKNLSAEDNTVELPENGHAVYNMGRNKCGLIGFNIKCEKDAVVYALFDETIKDKDPNKLNFLRLGTASVVMWKLPAGEYKLLTYEPYVYKYLRIVVMGSKATVSDVHVRRVGFYMPKKRVVTDNEKIKAVFDAAVETFRQNTCDIYMDCASRERGGWLCDSYFTSRVEYTLTGKSEVERNFLECFLQPESFKCLPKGMLPMCYPADHYDEMFIPNWAMWYVVELEEYLARSGDRELIDAAKGKVYDLLQYFRPFENKDGLLEKLESWVFVEWSKSNELVQDLNFPSNMLYARMKRSIAALYGDNALIAEAEKLEQTIREKSFNGKFFCDNMVYNEAGELVLSGECTESCQYYAFHTGVATPETYPELWETLLHDFGPQRKETGKHPDIYFANAFIGNYLRLDLLMNYGYEKEILDNMDGYFYYMAEQTGTLWENDGDYASCSHGFASHVIYWLDKLGMLEDVK